jgi:uncharacterized protein YjdB
LVNQTDLPLRLIHSRSVAWTVLALTSLSGSSCGDGPGGIKDPVLASVVISPPSAIIGAGDTQEFSASARDENGNPVQGALFAWSSSNPSVATVSETGVATGVTGGDVLIRATAGGVMGSSQLQVRALTTITVSPAFSTVMIGESQQFTAVAADQTGAPLEGIEFTWTTSAPAMATVTSAGLVTGVSGGDVEITATASGVSGSAQLRVREVKSITVSPETATLLAGETLQFEAVAKDQDGLPVEGVTFQWSSTNSPVATVTPLGLVKGVGGGTAEIQASAAGLTGAGTITVWVSALFSDGFETGDRSHTENGFKWYGGGGRVYVSSDNPRTGDYSLEFVFGPNPPGGQDWSEIRFDMGAIREEFWMEYYLYVPENYEHRRDNTYHNKFLALWGSRGYDEGNQLFLFINTWPARDAGWISGAYVAAWADDDQVSAYNDLFNFIGDAHRGTWIRVRYHVRPATTATAKDGIVEMWRDDTQLMSYHSVPFFHPVENGFRNGYLMGWSSSGFTEETHIFIDDFKVSLYDPGW